MNYRKISPGFVEQTFSDGECIKQEFKIVDHGGVEWENELGHPVNIEDMPLGGREYFPFDMRQPSDECYKEG